MVTKNDLKAYNKYAKKLGLNTKTIEDLDKSLSVTNTNIIDINNELHKKVLIKSEITKKERQIRGKADYILTGVDISQKRFNEIVADIFNLDNEIKGMYQYIGGDISETDLAEIRNNKIDVVDIDENQRNDYATFITDITNMYYKDDKKTVFQKNILEFTEQGYNNIVPIATPKDTSHFYNFLYKVKDTLVNAKTKDGKTSVTSIGSILKNNANDKDLIKLIIFTMKRGSKFNIYGNSDSKIDAFIEQISKSNSTWLYFKNLLSDDILEVY